MEIQSVLIQFGGSLIAIFALVGVARALGLGGRPVLKDDAAVRTAAGEVEDGFEPVRISTSRDGAAALAQSADGRIMVIKRHGNRFAGRVLTKSARVHEKVDAIIVDPCDARFGSVHLSINDANVWVDAINRL